MKAIFPCLAVAMILCGCAITPVRLARENVEAKVLRYSKFSEYLESRERTKVYGINFQRDSLGSKLFIKYDFRQGDESIHRTLIVTKSGIREASGPPRTIWYDDQENPLIYLEGVRGWFEGQGRSTKSFSKHEDAKVVFKNGPTIPSSEISEIDGVSGGDLVLIQFGRKTPWIISKAENPRQPVIELPKDLDSVDSAYVTAEELIVFGTWRLKGVKYLVKCLIYRASPTGYELVQEIPIRRAGNLYDFYPKTGDLMISGTATKFAGCYRFNIRTKRRIMVTSGHGSLFLKEDVIEALEAALNEGK